MLLGYFYKPREEQKESLYIYVDLLITKDGSGTYGIYAEEIIRTYMTRYIRSIPPAKTVLIQALYQFIYSKVQGVAWVDIKIGGSTIDFQRPSVMTAKNLVAESGQEITCNESLIRFEYKE